MPTKKNRKFISNEYTEKIFLVFYCDSNEKPKRNSCGKFQNQKKAILMMNQYLAKGLCSWIVTYNG